MITFKGSMDWAKENGFYSKELGFSLSLEAMPFACLKGNKEYVVLGDKKILDKLKELPNDSFLPVKMKILTKYLDDNNITYEVIGKAPAL